MASIDTPSTQFVEQHNSLAPCRDLIGGTESMRSAGTRHIPQEKDESAANYEGRLQRTVLHNIFAQTVNYNRGQVFSRIVNLDNSGGALDDESMQRFLVWSENVDQRGSNLTSWAGTVFARGLVDGVTFCLTDFPMLDPDSPVRSVAADTERNPYLVHIPAQNVLDIQAEWQNGRRVITHFRYLEETTEPHPTREWQLIKVRWVRAFWQDHWELWRKAEGDGSFAKVREGQLSVPYIPLSVFMAGDRRSEFTARPALMDLAWLNIRHWQATSEQADLLAYARRPVWAMTGVDQERDSAGNPVSIGFGPGKVLFLPAGATLASHGVDPAAISAGRQELKDLEDAMASYGMQLLTPKGNATATQIERETREANSTLRNWALDFQDFLENCLKDVGAWWGLEDGPSVKVNDEFGQNANVDYLLQLKQLGLIGSETLATFLKRAGVLPDDFDYAEEAAKVANDLAQTSVQGFDTALSEVLR